MRGGHLSSCCLPMALAKAFLLGLECGLCGVAIQILAALAIHVGDDFCNFHQVYLCITVLGMGFCVRRSIYM